MKINLFSESSILKSSERSIYKSSESFRIILYEIVFFAEKSILQKLCQLNSQKLLDNLEISLFSRSAIHKSSESF